MDETQQPFRERIEDRIRDWSVVVEHTGNSNLARGFGRRGDPGVVMTVL